MKLNVRTRLTLWHALATVLVVMLFAFGIHRHVRDNLYEQIDQRLTDSLALLSTTAREYREDFGEVEQHTLVLAFHVREGERPLYESRLWITDFLERAGTAPASGRWVFTTPRGHTYHLKSERVRVGARELVITAAEPADQTHRALKRLGTTLAWGLPLALLLSVLGGYFLAGRALAPLQQITHRARAISADNLSERIMVPNPHDELGQLTAVLNDAFARLEQSFDRLKRFTQDAAHELRTPLAVLRSVGEVGLQKTRDAKAYRDVIGSMLEEVDRLGRLVDGLLTLAKAESGRFSVNRRPEKLATLSRDVVECLRVLAEDKEQKLTFHADGAYTALVDSDTLRLALINLIANAVRFTPRGGAIHVRLGAHAGDKIAIAVEDTGPGIAPEDQAHLFERFYRVDASRAQHTGGAGLGLAIARWAVEANGGTIELDSAPGRGSVFRIVLTSV